ncbi:MAG TPA: permease prefix domain 1-containing protein, partial [Planctomycetaceae bacterium]|nr:permease prefix domain 1-containing protein [Planctomycetaceae bacterium]
MTWTDSAAHLPAPRDDEPPHLRQDIHDELADHLQSAMERELRQTTDEGAARERVLERFGDPRRVARKLWQDAMWEKLMSQRILVAMAGMILVASFGMFWMTWTIAQQGREMNAALVARLDRLDQQPAAANNP